MPTNLITSQPYSSPKYIFAGTPIADRMATIDTSFIQMNEDGAKIISPGYPIVPISGSNQCRLLPYSTLSTNTLAGNITSVVVSEARYFKTGDVVTIARPYATLTISLIWANADTITIEFDDVRILHTVSAFTTNEALAISVSQTLNANPNFNRKATAFTLVNSPIIWIIGKTSDNFRVAIIGDGSVGTGTITANTPALTPDVVFGTISQINALTNTLTLISNALPLPPGIPLSVAANPATILGISGFEAIVESNIPNMPMMSNDIPAYTRGAIYTSRMPVADRWLFDALPGLEPYPLNL